MNSKVKEKAKKLNIFRDISGSVLPISAVALVTMAGLIGGGVDMSRAYMVQNRLQNACDSGTLAGRRAVGSNGYTTAARNRADTFFGTNFDEANEGVSGTSFVTSSPDNGNTIEGTATTTVDTVVMQIFGFDEIDLSVTCTAAMSVGNSDIMLVLDTTGSMACRVEMTEPQCGSYLNANGTNETAHGGRSRLEDLRRAVGSFYDTVATSTAGGNARVRYGVVPYSSSVNVGQLLLDRDPSFLADENVIQSRVPLFQNVVVQTLAGYEPPVTTRNVATTPPTFETWRFFAGPFRNNRECRANQPRNAAWMNDGGTTTDTVGPFVNAAGQRITEETIVQRQTRTQYNCFRQRPGRHFVITRNGERQRENKTTMTEEPILTTTTRREFDRWRYEAVTYDTSALKTFAPVDAPVGDDGVDVSSTWSGCIEERATVAQDDFSFNRLLGIDPSGALDLDIDSEPTNDPDTQWKPMWSRVVFQRGNNLGPVESTVTLNPASSFCPAAAEGLRTWDESDFDSYVAGLTPSGSTYHSIGMIWGARLASPQGIFETTVNSAPSNGGEVARHLVFLSDGQISTNNGIQSSYGVEFYDRRVTDDGFSANNARHTARFLAACEVAKSKGIRVWVIAFATALTGDLESCASDDSAFTAASSSQLNDAFQEIAKDVGELRITQ